MPNQINTQERAVSLTKEAIITEAKRIEENCLYTSKGHFSAAHFWTNFHLLFGIPTVVAAAVAGASALTQFNNHNLVAGILSIGIVILTAVTTFLNPKERANIHLTSGNNYDSLLGKVRQFWTIECRFEESEKILKHKLDDYTDQRDRLNRESSQVPNFAHKKAKKGIIEGEATYKVDEVQDT